MHKTNPFELPHKTPLGIGESIAEWVCGLRHLAQYYDIRPEGMNTLEFLEYSHKVLEVSYKTNRDPIQAIPTSGATLIVSNHPLGCVDGTLLAEMLLRVRPDLKILANNYLQSVPELSPLFIGVDVFGSNKTINSNAVALRQAINHLKSGGLLMVFPAGEVASKIRAGSGIESQWKTSVANLVRCTPMKVVPVYFSGANSAAFYLAGKVHPIFRTLMLGREMLNKRGRCFKINIGDCLEEKELKKLTDNRQLINYLRLNTLLLDSQNQVGHKTTPHIDKVSLVAQAQPIAAPIEVEKLTAEIAALPQDSLLLSSGIYQIYCTTANNIPLLMQEIGRIREEAFRNVGEGSGQALDLDEFDKTYYQLFVWDQEEHRIVGAYRLGLVDKLWTGTKTQNLYSQTLFKYDSNFIKSLGNCIELGRSVVALEYQRNINSLLLLWKGICAFVAKNPSYRTLFGPVSISNDFSPEARQLLTSTLEANHFNIEWSKLVTATNPPQSKKKWQQDALETLADIQLLSKVVSRIDKEGKGVPVLLRQYLTLNGKFVCFNIDENFQNCLDGLIVVDLCQVPLNVLNRYMGKEQSKVYLEHQNNKNST